MKIGDAAIGIDHGDGRSAVVDGLDVRLDRLAFGIGKPGDLGHEIAEPVVHIDTTIEGRTVPGEEVAEEDPDGVSEDDRVGDLHHGGLHVQREEHAVGPRLFHLPGEEVHAERLM